MRRAALLFATLLLAALAASCAGASDAATTSKGDGPADPSGSRSRRAVDLAFRPVRSAFPCSSADGTTTKSEPSGMRSPDETGAGELLDQLAPPTTTGPPSTTTLVPPAPDGKRVLASADGTVCYLLGAAGATGADLASASASDQGTWGVTVEVAGRSKERLNDQLNDCYAGSPTCPGQSSDGRGQVAIVVDGRVVSAPSVNAEDLADGPLTISGTFTKREAEDLAAALNG